MKALAFRFTIVESSGAAPITPGDPLSGTIISYTMFYPAKGLFKMAVNNIRFMPEMGFWYSLPDWLLTLPTAKSLGNTAGWALMVPMPSDF